MKSIYGVDVVDNAPRDMRRYATRSEDNGDGSFTYTGRNVNGQEVQAIVSPISDDDPAVLETLPAHLAATVRARCWVGTDNGMERQTLPLLILTTSAGARVMAFMGRTEGEFPSIGLSVVSGNANVRDCIHWLAPDLPRILSMAHVPVQLHQYIVT